MVLAKTVNLNILDDNHFIVALVEQSLVDNIVDVNLVSLG